MTLVARFLLGCDKCGAVLEGHESPTALREVAKEKGWCRSKRYGVDFCPTCPRTRARAKYVRAKRFPVGPLIEALRPQKGWDNKRHLVPAQTFSYAQIGALFGLTNDTMRQRAMRGLKADMADEMACRVGLHPADVWKDWWD